MPRCDPQEGYSRPFRLPPPLLPIAQDVHANPHGLAELLLSQVYEAPQGRNVLTGVDTPGDEASPQPARNGTGEVFLFELGNLLHHFFPLWLLKRTLSFFGPLEKTA